MPRCENNEFDANLMRPENRSTVVRTADDERMPTLF